MPLSLTSEDREPVTVSGPRFVLGRDPGCDLVLDDEQVSRRHALIEATDTGGYVLRNLSSRNGTYLDGERVDAPAPLTGGEVLRLGRVTLRTELTRTPADDATRAVNEIPAGVGAEALPAPLPAYSAIQRIVAEAMTPEMRSIRSMSRKGLLVRGLGAFCGSVVVAILWRILS